MDMVSFIFSITIACILHVHVYLPLRVGGSVKGRGGRVGGEGEGRVPLVTGRKYLVTI